MHSFSYHEQIHTGCKEIDGWVIAADRRSCEKQGHKLAIVTEVMPARLGAAKLPKGTPNLKTRYGSLYKPEYTEYLLTLDGRCIVRGSGHVVQEAVFQYFRRERRVEGMTYEAQNDAGPRRPMGGSTMRGVTGIAMLMAISTIEELAKQDPREFDTDQQIPDEFRDHYKKLADPATEIEEGQLPF